MAAFLSRPGGSATGILGCGFRLHATFAAVLRLQRKQREPANMKTILRAAAAVLLAGAITAPAFDATVHFHGGSVGFVVGVGGASGVVTFHGRKYPISVNGLSVGTIGANSYDVDGDVYHLHNIADIEGTYAAAEASATAGAGAGGIDMTNGHGVEIRASSTSSGLKLTLGGSGVVIKLK
jgi:hypothetical protein